MRQKNYLRRSTKQWQRIIDKQKATGEPVSAYCRKYGLCKQSFYAWRKRLSEAVAPVAPEPDRFLELIPPSHPQTGQTVRIETPKGYRVEIPEGTGVDFLTNIFQALVQ